jgi:2,4-diaminopentanoate dehydrogenase C-terminal domain
LKAKRLRTVKIGPFAANTFGLKPDACQESQTAKGLVAGKPLIILILEAYVGCPDPKEWIVIDGVPPIDLTLKGGVHGDIATAAVVVNSIPRVLNVEPGLVTMKGLPVPAAWFAGIDAFVNKSQ